MTLTSRIITLRPRSLLALRQLMNSPSRQTLISILQRILIDSAFGILFSLSIKECNIHPAPPLAEPPCRQCTDNEKECDNTADNSAHCTGRYSCGGHGGTGSSSRGGRSGACL